MAVVTIKSGAITNRDATPVVKNSSFVDGGELRQCAGTLESVSGDSIGSTYIFCQVPSNCRIKSVLLYCDDIGSTTIADFGIYKTTADGSAVVDADFFGSAVSLKDGALNGTDITHESGAYDLNEIEKPLWLALGLSTDPKIMYDVVATLTAASDAAGTVALEVAYAM